MISISDFGPKQTKLSFQEKKSGCFCVYGSMFGENIYNYQKNITADFKMILVLKSGNNLKSYSSMKLTISVKETSDGNNQ